MLVKVPDARDGDEVAVLNASKAVLGSGLVRSGQAVIAVWGDNTLTPDIVEGARDGETLTLALWKSSDQAEKLLTVIALTDALTNKQGEETVLKYQKNQIVIAATATALDIPKEFTLSQNYPNPFNPSTTIEFTVPEDGKVSLKIYNIVGQMVAMSFEGDVQAGYIQKVVFNASRLSSGVYFSRLQYKDKNLIKKIILMK